MEETIMRLAGVPVRFRCYSKKTFKYMERFIPDSAFIETEAVLTVDSRDMPLLFVSQEELVDNPVMEYTCIMLIASDALMNVNRCIFHGVAFIWREKAWILTAPSGTGKTTQLRNLKELYGQEILCINGDKPALEFRKNGDIVVHDSFWRGKEGWGTKGLSCKLAGVFYLQQEGYNIISEFPPDKSIIPLYWQFFSTFKSENILCHVSKYEDLILRKVPVMLFKNLGDLDSTRLLYQTIKRMDSEK